LAVPSPTLWGASDTITQAKLNADYTAITFLLEPPRVKVYKTADGALAHATWDAVNFGAEAFDSQNFHDNSTNNSRLVAPDSGLYVVKGHATFDINTNGIRGLGIRKNAAASHASGTDVVEVIGAGNGTTQARIIATDDVQLVAGDYLELFCYQGSGGALNVLGGIANTFLSMRWVARTA
jgi:hypothetical protein